MEKLDPGEKLTVGKVTQGKAPNEQAAGIICEKVERGADYCLQAIYAVALALAVFSASLYFSNTRFLSSFLLVSLASANALHAHGLFYLRHADSLYGKYRLINVAFIVFSLSVVFHFVLIACYLFRVIPQESVSPELTLLSGILSLLAHGALLVGLLNNKSAALDLKYCWCVWTALICVILFYGSLTLLAGLSLDPTMRESILRITEHRPLTIGIGCVFLAVGLIGIVAYTWALYLLKKWSIIPRLMFGNLSPYDL